MYRFLKKTRVWISLIFLVLITLNFMVFANHGTQFFSEFLKFQFVPSLMGAITGSVLAFVLLMILTLLFGRVYCSTLCPLGIFQDVVSKIAGLFKSKKGKRYKFHKPYNWLRYTILSLTGLFFIFGITIPLAYLDPYSNYGRISSEILSRSEHLIHNGLAQILPDTVFVRSYTVFIAGSFIFAMAFLLLVIILSAFRGRLYCNTVCPVGSFLGLFSKFSLFKPVINDKCVHCMACVQKCKSQCIDIENKRVDQTRCVACLNCMDACKKGAISYQFSFKTPVDKKAETNSAETNKIESKERRRAIIALGLMGTALAARAVNFAPFTTPASETDKDKKRKIIGIVPPGAKSQDHLKKNCTACHACIAACPNKIIIPATGEYGMDGLLLPVLSYKEHYCSYDCNVCSQVCPNGAILPLSLEEKQRCQLGKAKYTFKNCIVYTDKTECGACSEHCPTKAITMVPYRDYGLLIPKVDKDICIGCGACEYVCPAVPLKAIVIVPNEVQGISEKPTVDKQKKVTVDEFGF